MTPVIRTSRPRSTGWRGSLKTRPAIPHMSGVLAPGRTRPLAHPQLEANQRPQTSGAVTPTRVVDPEHSLNLHRTEDPPLARARGEQDVPSHVAQLTAEPRPQGHAETHLRPTENRRRERAAHGPLEQVLSDTVFELEGRRDRRH